MSGWQKALVFKRLGTALNAVQLIVSESCQGGESGLKASCFRTPRRAETNLMPVRLLESI
ncbi:hypothetical protein N9Q14_00490 [Pseudomonadales bacterium]|nr:hypothetical protein [Pseudomonadales bacterium]